jgi:hypothetical protein
MSSSSSSAFVFKSDLTLEENLKQSFLAQTYPSPKALAFESVSISELMNSKIKDLELGLETWVLFPDERVKIQDEILLLKELVAVISSPSPSYVICQRFSKQLATG